MPISVAMETTAREMMMDLIARKLDMDPAELRRRNLVRAFPAFAPAKIAQSWGRLIDTTPDAVPVIGPVPSVPGFYLMSGFSGHGFGIGPGAGRLMAELYAPRDPEKDRRPRPRT